MPNRLVAGLAAGAAGTVALNVTTYVDMLVRGRAASELPARVAEKLADELSLPLGDEVEMAGDADDSAEAGERAANRQEALGALLGYANGIVIGLAYGILRVAIPPMPLWVTSAALGSAAMAASDVPATRMGLTDPTNWATADWIADVVPHLVYGVVTALTFEALRD